MNGTDKRVKTIVGAGLLLWLGLAYILGAKDAFMRAPGALPLPILAGVLTPILVFLVAFWAVGPFRDFVMSMDLPVMAGIQAWRFGGLGFIALYAYGVLPGLFAWPAAFALTRAWLNGFAYRVSPGFPLFILAGLAAVGIAFATVSFQSFKAARADPVDALKYE